MEVKITDTSGGWTGAWFETDAATCYGPPPNRGRPLQLWKTAHGAWILVDLVGTDQSPITPTAVVCTEERALAILAGWGHTDSMSSQQRDDYESREV